MPRKAAAHPVIHEVKDATLLGCVTIQIRTRGFFLDHMDYKCASLKNNSLQRHI